MLSDAMRSPTLATVVGEAIRADSKKACATAPTVEQTTAYQAMFDYLNRTLFCGSLPHVMLNFSRKVRAAGFFAPQRWRKGESKAHEISINPEYMQSRPAREVASTLAHEMVHLWQHEAGKKKPKRAYHNKEWADKMLAIGLTPSRTGKPGGVQTGMSMSHFVTDGGPFARAFDAMPPDCLLPWTGQLELRLMKPRDKGKIKHTCPNCPDVRAYCKEDAPIKCGKCGSDLEMAS